MVADRRASTATARRSWRCLEDFEALASLVTEDAIAEAMPCGPDKRPILDAIGAYVDAGYDHVYLHQVGPDQRGFLDFAAGSSCRSSPERRLRAGPAAR